MIWKGNVVQDMEQINAFWAWFKENERRVLDAYDSEAIGDEIDAHLKKIDARLGWEIGPTDDSRVYLAISPNLDCELVTVARNILGVSCQSNCWEFFLGRQRKPWSDIIQIMKTECRPRKAATYDLSKWRFVAFRLPDSGLVDVVFECGEACFEDENIEELGMILISCLIGEMTVMEKVDSIEVVHELEEKYAVKSKPVTWLPYVFGYDIIDTTA
jgi:hypothetical protein